MTIKGRNSIRVSARIPVDLWWDLEKLCVDQKCTRSELIKQAIWLMVQAIHSADAKPKAGDSADSPDFGTFGDFGANEVLRETYKGSPEADYVKKMRAQGKEWFQIRQGIRAKFGLALTGREVKALFHK